MAAKDPTQIDEPAKPNEVAERRHQETLEQLKAEWDRRLQACFGAPDFPEQVDAIMDAHGCAKVRPKAGETF